MEFCLASVAFWIQAGFNVEQWRKSLDGSHALVHKEQAEILVPDCDTNEHVTVLRYKSAALKQLLESSEWKAAESAEEK